jgi:hypothetical protein
VDAGRTVAEVSSDVRVHAWEEGWYRFQGHSGGDGGCLVD